MANPRMPKQRTPTAAGPIEPVEINDTRMPKDRIEPDQIKDWAKRLNVSTTRLREAVQRAGPAVQDVKRFLEHH